jgi:two-component system sensor histidine kinase/response regulator
MNGVIGMTGLLLDTDLTPQQRDWAETVRRSGEALMSILNDILDFSKAEAGRLEFEAIAFDPEDAIEEVIDLFREHARRKGLHLHFSPIVDVPFVVIGDPGRIRQVLLNLLSNAVKFTERGEVRVTADVAGEEGERIIIRITVTDTGLGISPDALRAVFEPFTQADSSTTRRFGGTGLGLAICRRLVEAMGGEIGASSKPGEGSTFWFSIPLMRSAEACPHPGQLAGLRALIVQSDQSSANRLRRHLEREGMAVEIADGADAAMQNVTRSSGGSRIFDVVLLDDCPDVCPRDTDVVAMATALCSSPYIAESPLVLIAPDSKLPTEVPRAGMTACLPRPVSRSRLIATIDEILRPARALRRESRAPVRVQCPDKIPPLPILVAEDNPVNQKVVQAILNRLGFQATCVANGCEAVEAVRMAPYDLILMDCQMPEMDGYEAARRIRAIEPEGRRARIIALTANALAGDREKCLAAGMDDYLAKPVRYEDVAQILHREFARWTSAPAARRA